VEVSEEAREDELVASDDGSEDALDSKDACATRRRNIPIATIEAAVLKCYTKAIIHLRLLGIIRIIHLRLLGIIRIIHLRLLGIIRIIP
jgi:hypothetical protein